MSQTQMKWNAVEYAQNSSAQYGWAQSLIERLVLGGSEHILDLGCGDGRITAELARMVSGRVVGIDSSTSMVQLAARQFAAESNLVFKQMDATALAFNSEFDVVFSNAVLHWVRDHQTVLQGIARALKPEGKLILSMGGQGNAAGFVSVVNELIQSAHWQSCFEDFVFPYAFYGIEEYEQWLPGAGLRPKRIELVAKDMVHDNVAALKGWIRTTWLPYTNRVVSAQSEVFIDELVAAYIERFPLDMMGRTHIEMIRLEVEAVKN